MTIPRSREVGQSYLTSIWTTLLAVWAALAIIYREAPQLVRSILTASEAPMSSIC